jgi:hypothetical protein
MKNSQLFVAVGLFLASLSTAWADANLPPPSLGGLFHEFSGTQFGIAPGTLNVTDGGSGYSAGEVVTLACTANGATITWVSPPLVGIWQLSGGVVTNPQTLSYSGITSGPVASGTVSCTQASTTNGSGSGITLTAQLAPYGLPLVGSLGNQNGTLIINNPEGTATPFAGSEGTLIGDKAGAGDWSGNAYQITAIGHNACGSGGSGASSPQVVCIGTDSARNIEGVDDGDTWTGTGSGRNQAGATGFNSGFGFNVAGYNQTNSPGRFIGSWDNLFGALSGTNLTSGSANILIGPEFELTTGSNNIIIDAKSTTLGSPSSDCDTPSSSTNGFIGIGVGGGCWLQVTGAGTPSTSVTTIAGSLAVNDGATISASGVYASPTLTVSDNSFNTGIGIANTTSGGVTWTLDSTGFDNSYGAGLLIIFPTSNFSGNPAAIITPAGITSPTYTVSTLPSGYKGARAYVTDATSCTFLGSLTGGSSTFCPVIYNGSAWVGG